MTAARLSGARPLVGRDALLARIGSQLDELGDSRGALLLLTGEAGIGKTRFAEEVVGLARGRGARAAWATSWQGEGAPPLWPWVQVLRQLVGSDDALRHVRSESPATSPAAHFAQSDAVAQALRDVAADTQLVVVLDDLHWADAASIRVLTFVASVTRDIGCLLIGAYRPDEMVDEHVAALTQVGTHLAVPRLTPEHATEVLRASVGTDVSTAARDAVIERSAGNPLFVWEFGQLMAESGRRDVAPAAVPNAVAAVIERRLARLSESVVTVLRAAAVAGKAVTAETVALVGGIDREAVLTAFDDACAAGIMSPTDVSALAFSHDVVREVVLAGMDRRRLADLHRRAAVELERRLAGDPSLHAVVAHHYDGAGPEHAPAASARWEAAAHFAETVLAYDEAATFFAHAARTEGEDPERRTKLVLAQGDALLRAGALESARTHFREAATLARSIGRPDLVAHAVLGMGTGPVAWEVPIASAEQATLVSDTLDALPDDAIALRSMLLSRLSVAAATPQTTDLARRRAESALELAEAVRNEQVIAQALAAVNDAYAGPAHTMRRRDNADMIVELAASAGDPMLEALGYRFRIVADLEVGDVAAVDRDISEFTRLADELRHPLVGWYVPLFRGMRALLAGDISGAERHHRRVAAAATATVSHNAEMMARTLLLGIQVASGNQPSPDALDGLFDVDPADWASYASGLAYVSCLADDRERARALLKVHADNGFARLGDDGEHLTTLVFFGRVAVEVGEAAATRAVYELLLPHADLWAVDGIAGCCWGPIELELGRLAIALDQLDSARAHLTRARASVERADARLLRREVEALEAECERHQPSALESTDAGGTHPNVFRRDGQFWTLSYEGRETRMKDAKGLADLRQLLARPGAEVHVLDLAGPSSGAAGARGAPGDLGELLDARARAEFRRRLAELEDELADAESCADLGRAERARVEHDFIAHELASALGLRGRARRSDDPVERARKAVTGRIRLTIGRIGGEHPDLARHLTNSVRTGMFCVYAPERPVDWYL